MKSSLNCGLKGAYKVDLYKGAGNNREFVETTNWFDNDITNVGLNYPYYYPFANCFMFLSLGSGAAGSSRYNLTGLTPPNDGFLVYSSTYTGAPPAGYPSGTYVQKGQYIGWQGYEIGGVHSSSNTTSSFLQSTCGTKFTPSGINFYRGWTIPTGVQSTEGSEIIADPNGLVISSLMVSPSSGSNTTGKYAFSIVDRNITIPSGYSATITYNLSLNFQDYGNQQTFFSGIYGGTNGYFNTGSAYTGINNSELSLLSGWSKLSGFYRMIFPGINFVNFWGGVESTANRGNELEPYISKCLKTFFYLSPDIAQFAVNKFGPDNQEYLTGESQAYNSNGLGVNYYESVVNAQNNGQDISMILESSADAGSVFGSPNTYYYDTRTINKTAIIQDDLTPNNIRLSPTIDISNYSGAPATYGTSTLTYNKLFVDAKRANVDFATPGKDGFDYVNYSNYGNISVCSSMLQRLPIPIGGVTANTGTRSKRVTKSALFSPIQSLGYNSRFSSLTLGYGTPMLSTPSIYPYVDFLFLDSSGRAADMPHYRLIPDIYLTNRGTGVVGAKFYITGSNGQPIDSANRFSGANAFMGPGVNSNSSGIDFSNLYLVNTISDVSSSFVPPGTKTSGLLFPGQNINTNVIGSSAINNGTGWGAVYGIIGSSEFYKKMLDTCLIDYGANPWQNGTWKGFSGDGLDSTYPNPTGDQSKLFWPIKNSGIGICASGMAYYSPNFNNVFYDGAGVNEIIPRGYQLSKEINYNNTGILSNMVTFKNAKFTFTGVGVSPITVSCLTNNTLTGIASGYELNSSYSMGSGLNNTAANYSLYRWSGGIATTGSSIPAILTGYGNDLTGSTFTGNNILFSGYATGYVDNFSAYPSNQFSGNGTLSGTFPQKTGNGFYSGYGVLLPTYPTYTTSTGVTQSGEVIFSGYGVLSQNLPFSNNYFTGTGILSGAISFSTGFFSGFGTGSGSFSAGSLGVFSGRANLTGTPTLINSSFYTGLTQVGLGLFSGYGVFAQNVPFSNSYFTGTGILSGAISMSTGFFSGFGTGSGSFSAGSFGVFSGRAVSLTGTSTAPQYFYGTGVLSGVAPIITGYFSGYGLGSGNSIFGNLGYFSGNASITGIPTLYNGLFSGRGGLTGQNVFSTVTGSNILSGTNNLSGVTSLDYSLLSLSPTDFCKPSGLIHHIEVLKDANGNFYTGYRLLPNYALPNSNGVNNYSPVRGGSYPGLSMQNGMQVYFDFIWSGA